MSAISEIARLIRMMPNDLIPKDKEERKMKEYKKRPKRRVRMVRMTGRPRLPKRIPKRGGAVKGINLPSGVIN